jgi:hypothetical protein
MTVTNVLAVAGLAVSSATAAQPWLPVTTQAHTCSATCGAVDRLERALFSALPPEQKLEIARGLAARGQTDEAYERVAHLISRDAFVGMRPEWKAALDKISRDGNPGIAACFEPGTSEEVTLAFDQLLFGAGNRFQPGTRWSSTAYSGGGLQQGDPTIISYSFIPDGTTILDAGFGAGPSQLFAWMNGIYGNTATWQNLFHSVFDRWEELSGNTYVFETNDDGVSQSNDNNPGVAGVRGDVRIGAKNIDGGGGVLAYNFFPQNGDMVLDAFDSFYNNTGGNSIRLRNIISHEHGHGKGANHVCPADGTKLMEPFINVNFDGPQLDDILLAQRLYGDPNETNDNAATATDLGAVSSTTLSLLSIDDNGDQDWYRVSVPADSELSVTVLPTGASYIQGPQTSACNTGTAFDSLRIHDLRFEIIDTNGVSVLASVNNAGLGVLESTTLVIEDPGNYFIRVLGDTTNNIQAYSLSVTVEDLPFIPVDIDLVGSAPTAVDPGVPTPVVVTIDPNDETIAPGSERLRFRDSGGSFQSIPLVAQGGGQYAASLPASLCGANPEFFFEVQGNLSGVITLPEGGASSPFTAIVGDIVVEFEDDFETDTGWTVSGSINTNSAGRWQRGVPVGANDSRVADPGSDLDGSGQCFVTGNVLDNSDVDGGNTILTSPAFDVSGNPEATISYARWFDNNEGGSAANPFTETFVVEISGNNGGSWVNLETVGPTGPEVSGGWITKTFRVADFVTPSANVRVRFIASDDFGTVVEAGVDAVSVSGLSCEDPVNNPCNAADLAEPFDVLDLADVNAFITGFTQQTDAGDVDNNGIWDLGDINAFVLAFTAGCP